CGAGGGMELLNPRDATAGWDSLDPSGWPRAGGRACVRGAARPGRPETKGRPKAAAGRSGLSLTTFILRAAEKAAEAVEKQEQIMVTQQQAGGVKFRGVPTFFRALCAEAARGGYYRPGYELARHMMDLVPYEAEGDDWLDELVEFRGLFEAGDLDDPRIREWLVRHYPRCMELVPERRQRQFNLGVSDAVNDGLLDA